MKSTLRKKKSPVLDPRTARILKSLQSARRSAVKSARMHGVPIIYLRNGKIIRERP